MEEWRGTEQRTGTMRAIKDGLTARSMVEARQWARVPLPGRFVLHQLRDAERDNRPLSLYSGLRRRETQPPEQFSSRAALVSENHLEAQCD